jgi:hypothetical protein
MWHHRTFHDDHVDHFGRSTIRRQHAEMQTIDRGENSEPGENAQSWKKSY